MRNLASSFTMRKDGVLPRGDWFTFKTDDETPKIYIYDEIGFWGTEASEFVKQLNEIKGKKLELHLNSPGGEVFDGLAIYNALKQHKAEVAVYVDGLAASAASFIAQAGDNVIMARNATMMIHDGIGFAYGNEQDMLDTAMLLSQISDNIADIYAYRAQQRGFDTNLEDFRALMREEVWYTGKEALDAGLCDEVLDSDDDEAETAKNKWDLSFYNHAGRERAESPTRITARLLVSNQAKEKDMADRPRNEGEQPTEEPTETGGVPTGDPTEEGVTIQPQDPATTEPTEVVTADQPETPAPQPTAENKVHGVMINGKLETDYAVISQHFAALSAAQEEQRAANRTKFVESLAENKKIAASQINSLLELVNGKDTTPGLNDEQFAAFQASYESAPASSLFDTHATTTVDSSTPRNSAQMTDEQKQDRIAVLRGTIAMHERASMTREQIKNTKSYIELQSLLGESKS